MDSLYAVFHLAKEAIDSPNNMTLQVIPCMPGKASVSFEAREEYYLPGQGAEYPPDTEWVAAVTCDNEEEIFAAGASPKEAVDLLVIKLKEMVTVRCNHLETVLDEADCPTET